MGKRRPCGNALVVGLNRWVAHSILVPPQRPGKVLTVLKTLRPLVTAAVVAVLAGCSALSPITTSLDYSAPDGTQISTEDVLAHNMKLIATEVGGPALLTGSLSNRSGDDARVDVSWDGGSASIAVGAGQTVLLGPDHERVEGTSPVLPGLVVDLTIATPGTTQTGPVPVLDATLPEYARYVESLDTTP